jgi:hypothetical protein
MLRLVRSIGLREGQQVTALSGEIHLATRGEMDLGGGRVLHQLVASGIAHRAPPKGWARVLGALSTLGDAPLRGHPVQIRRIPDLATRYVAERNYLVLSRENEAWQAEWQFEQSERSDALKL